MTNPESDSGLLARTTHFESDEQIHRTFEDAWHRGTIPSLDATLNTVPQQDRDRVFYKLLLIEIKQREGRGQAVTLQEYLSRFPQYENQIQRAFAEDGEATASPAFDTVSVPVPDKIGRFEVRRELGVGGFGRVYLAWDPQLQRKVALKVMRGGKSHIDDTLREARNAAKLNHESIVTVHDVSAEDDELFIVQEYVSGESLAQKLDKRQRFSMVESVRIGIAIARGLAFAHRSRIFHRDVKPGNILIGSNGKPQLIDFGLAISEGERQHHRGEVAGSTNYMAPEQFRGESHRVNERTDIWALCVVLYRLLTGRLPFTGESHGLISEQVQFVEPVPLRQINPTIPLGLERLVQKGLSKRMTDRHATCNKLIDHLRSFAENDSTDLREQVPESTGFSDAESIAETAVHSLRRSAVPVVPRGLLPFSRSDADFYPTLLPGPIDRDGLPPAISLWLDRIANASPETAVPVGIIYGQSGCGKSSLVQAGILPRIGRNTIPIYADCTDAGTEERIIEAVNLKCGSPEDDEDILRRFVAVRETSRKQNRKVLVVLDQFEQWLHGRTNLDQQPLTLALRQCDGIGLQVLIIVRDDFWLAVSQFLRAIEVPIAEDRNAMAVEQPGIRHAKQTLKRFGISYGAIPEIVDDQTEEHEQFLDLAIEELSDGTHVPCVALSLFAHMSRDESWAGSTLTSAGGTDLVGVRYLERIFADSGPLQLRRYSEQAKLILDLLLPAHGTNIKGHTRTYAELSAEVGLPEGKLNELLRIMDKELSLVTVSDTEGDTTPAARSFRLAHDYMVGPIRDWSTRSKRRTRRGRAALDLRESASRWNGQRIKGLLPSFVDYVRYQALVPKSEQQPFETEFLAAWANRNYSRVLAVAIAIAALLIGANEFRTREGRRADVVAKVAALADVGAEDFMEAVHDLDGHPAARSELVKAANDDSSGLQIRAWVALRLLDESELSRTHVEQAAEFLRAAEDVEGKLLLQILGDSPELAAGVLNDRFDPADDSAVRYASALVILGETDAADQLVGPNVSPTDRSSMTLLISDWTTDWEANFKLVGRTKTDPLVRSAVADSVSLGWNQIRSEVQSSLRENCAQFLATEIAAPTLVSSVSHILEATGTYEMETRFEKNWFVNSVGIRFLRLGQSEQGPHWSVFLADRETSNQLVRTYLSDPDTPKFEFNPLMESGRLPAHTLTLWQAAHFCNWLSDREGLDRCYQFVDGVCELIPDQPGYRIPTLAEFDFAARGVAGTDYHWHCMERLDEGLFARYEVVGNATRGRTDTSVRRVGETPTRPPGSRLPNSFGFYDTLANVKEWTWAGTRSGTYRIYGIGADQPSARLVVEARNKEIALPPNKPDKPYLTDLVGFRLAITRNGDDQPPP